MATAMLSPLEQRLRDEIERELRASVEQQLEQDAARRLETRTADIRREHADKLAAYLRDVENDLQARADAQAQRLWEQRRDNFLDKMESVKERADAAEAKAACLSAGLEALIRAILPQEDTYRALGRFCRIETLDMATIGPALAHIGLRLGFRATESAHAITLQLPHGVQMMHLVSLKRNLPRSVDPRTEETAVDGPVG